jgi:hypothetical protein
MAESIFHHFQYLCVKLSTRRLRSRYTRDIVPSTPLVGVLCKMQRRRALCTYPIMHSRGKAGVALAPLRTVLVHVRSGDQVMSVEAIKLSDFKGEVLVTLRQKEYQSPDESLYVGAGVCKHNIA